MLSQQGFIHRGNAIKQLVIEANRPELKYVQRGERLLQHYPGKLSAKDGRRNATHIKDTLLPETRARMYAVV